MSLELEYSVGRYWKCTYALLLFFSLCSASVIPIIYAYSPKCRHHPAQIVLILCILEMITCYQLFLDSVEFQELIQFLDKLISYNKIREYYLFGQGTISDETLCQINQSLIFFGLLAQLNYYAILTLDFILTLTKPFLNTKMKQLSYNFSACLITIVMYYIEKDQFGDISCKNIGINESSQIFKFQLVVIIILLIFSCYVGIKDLYKMKKINIVVRENRKKLFFNHIYLFSTLLIMWSLPIIIELLREQGVTKKLLTRFYFAIMLIHPIILLWIRLREPYFKSRTVLLFATLFCKKKWKENKDKTVDDNIMEQCQLPLNKLVQEQTNQETVSNILSSILKIVSYDEKIIDLHRQCRYKKEFKFSSNKNESQIDQQSPLLCSINYSLELTLTFLIQEYAPAVFQDIREKNGIEQKTFQQSLRLDLNQDQIKKTQESLGKSGSFFFYTYDNIFVLKTITQSELKLIQDFLEDYYNYIIKDQTFLAKFYGLYSISIEGFSQIHLLLMENIFQQIPKARVVYDLKGSLVNRKQNVKQSQVVDLTCSFAQYLPQEGVLKDQNFIKSTDIFIQLKQLKREKLFNILKEDIEFLLKNNIMDYSLLIAVCNSKQENEKRIFCNSSKCFCFGLIDYTQKFTFKKKLEYFYKFHVKRKGQQISCVNPQIYSQRFISFINSIIAINDWA